MNLLDGTTNSYATSCNFFRLGVISNTNETHCRYLETNFQVFNCFETRIYSHVAGLEKPGPKIYEKALQNLKVRAEESLFLDDKQENVLAAESLGFQAIHLQEPRSLPARLKERLPESSS